MLSRIALCLGIVLVTLLTDDVDAADNLDRFEARTYAGAGGEKLNYRLLKPKDYDPNKKYPLVLFMHGAGERGDDNKRQLVHGMNDFASDEVMAKYPAFVVAPQCPNGKKWVEVDWGAAKHTAPEKPSISLQLTFETLDAIAKEFSIDDKRIYVTGLSMGGYGTWDSIERKPDYFAAAAPICGGGDVEQAKKLTKLPIWAFHGDKDTAVKPERSRDMIAAIKAAGGEPKYTEYPGVGHNSWTATYRNPEFYAWLFAQKK
ncbi:Prolyl oligopeptidase family protein [Anatilimnocola aggregata]|uniref:Prolyl oligopeptidase family protein n=1 Tax=Anatilimnocola aggregata TaxID=2528021 RepID=A0A517YIE5_9BACT|nr:prolyl oligopeptidase family serine peptidase [Anatilimnocola aggregata]QDU30003.1 Prolyl oligopeptidase family protein [Anatilimnocola aggregata]